MRINDKSIGDGHPVYVIAEIGNNHNGDFNRAFELVDIAVEAGADCAKFQMRQLDQVYRESSLTGADNDLSVEYTLDLLRKFELTVSQQKALSEYCAKKGIHYLCTPWDPTSARVLADDFNVPAFKIASADLTNHDLIESVARLGRPLIVSTGMSRRREIEATCELLNGLGAEFALLHCQSTYPAAFHNINLNYLEELRRLHPLVGYSGHERGTAVTIGAVALGARLVERHLTLDRTMEGPDHAASLEPNEFKALVAGIRECQTALGPVFSPGAERPLSQGELMNRENLGKSLVAARDIAAGESLTDADVVARSPGLGLSPLHRKALVGRTLDRAVSAGDFFFETDLEEARAESVRAYSFSRPWGVPVRYHDTDDFLKVSRPDLIEFHLSYQDMDRDPREHLERNEYDLDFVVHAPELFAGSQLLDLATPDEDYRRNSIREMQRVIEITRGLKALFPRTQRPMIVANIGGISMDAPLSEDEKLRRYDIFEDSLSQLDMEGVEVIPQTMAPFPWHFGGQRFQNLFVFPDESARYCRRFGLRMCLDVSHSFLASNHFHIPFESFFSELSGLVGHLHIGDASGVDGEGLQIGEGQIDFEKLAAWVKTHSPGAWFIPEIWQGHKNNGQGFWTALERLEGKL